jgi:hypothetical protein
MCALVAGPALAADYWDGDPGLRGAIQPKDWSEMGDPNDSLKFETGVRYWYSIGGQSFSSGGGATTVESDTTHAAEAYLRIDDRATNTLAKANAGYSFLTNGTYAGPLMGGAVADGHIAYLGADFGWNAFEGSDGSGAGLLVGYNYWNSAPNTGRQNYTTATAGSAITYDPATGQTFLPGSSAPDSVDVHMLRLGLQGRINLGDMIDITGEVVGVPYAKVSGTMGMDDPSFNTAVYGGPAQLPYSGVASGNISAMRSSPTAIDGWGYGAMAEAWLGIHPAENVTFRVGGRAWYLQGTVDATYGAVQVGNPTDADSDGTFDTAPLVTSANYITTGNPFSMIRYGVLAELSYRF